MIASGLNFCIRSNVPLIALVGWLWSSMIPISILISSCLSSFRASLIPLLINCPSFAAGPVLDVAIPNLIFACFCFFLLLTISSFKVIL